MANAPESLQDFTKSLMDLDVTKGAEQLLNALSQLKVPGVDMDALVAGQRDNLEALTKANQAAMEGMKEVGKWQIKVLKQTVEEISKATGEMTKLGEMYKEAAQEAYKPFEATFTKMQGTKSAPASK